MDNAVIIGIIIIIVLFFYFNQQSSFNNTIGGSPITNNQPESFPPLDQPVKEVFNINRPDVKEEIGLAMLYPQGGGVGMDRNDSNSFYPSKPGPLLTDHVGPESYGESSLTDPTGSKQGARVIKLNDTGNQMLFKPVDETENQVFHSAYTKNEVQDSETFINGAKVIDYSDSFNPESGISLQISPGQESNLNICEKMYPNVVKYNNFCITEGDIPYGQVVDNKVNPRLVSRWESYTGEYSRKDALLSIDGVLYPTLPVISS